MKGDVANNTWADPEFKSDSLILLYGTEWTTTRAHGNTFSATPYEHQLFYNIRDQRDTLIGRVKNEMGIHLSANHPSGKDHFGYSYDIINSIEVWNSSLWERNIEALMIWDDMLSSGRMITGRGGHGYPDTPEETSFDCIFLLASITSKLIMIGTIKLLNRFPPVGKFPL